MGAPRSAPKAVVVGGSAGGAAAVGRLLSGLPPGLAAPILVVLHVGGGGGLYLPSMLGDRTGHDVLLAEDKERPEPGRVYVAPGDYHLLVEADGSLAVSQDTRVQYSRPSIDVLFESAAEAYGRHVAGVLLTGANADGSRGLRTIHEFGGVTVVQDPASAEVPTMPEAALRLFTPTHVLPLERIALLLKELCALRGDKE